MVLDTQIAKSERLKGCSHIGTPVEGPGVAVSTDTLSDAVLEGILIYSYAEIQCVEPAAEAARPVKEAAPGYIAPALGQKDLRYGGTLDRNDMRYEETLDQKDMRYGETLDQN